MEKNTKDEKWLKITGAVCSFIIITVAVLICFSIKWMFDTWTNLSMEELVYHLTAPLEGTNEEMIWQYVRVCVVPTILIMAGISALVVFGRKKKTILESYCRSSCYLSFSADLFCIWSVEKTGHRRLYGKSGRSIYIYRMIIMWIQEVWRLLSRSRRGI